MKKFREPILIQKMYYTEYKNYTPKEVVDLFGHLFQEENVKILIDHLSDQDLSPLIYGVSEQDRILYLGVGNEEDKELCQITLKNK
jgi:hypothetical protein